MNESTRHGREELLKEYTRETMREVKEAYLRFLARKPQELPVLWKTLDYFDEKALAYIHDEWLTPWHEGEAERALQALLVLVARANDL